MLAICIVIGAPTGYAQNFKDGPADIFAGCETDTRAPSDGASPRERIERQATTKIDKVTQRAFASFSMDDIERGVPEEMSSLCWARLDGVWREIGQVTLDLGKNNPSVWGSDRGLVSMANGNYTTPRNIVIVESSKPEKILYLSPGLTGTPFVKFISNDGILLREVLKRGGRRKTYTATQRFEFGNQVVIDVTRSGRVRLRLGRMEFIRPQLGVSRASMEKQLPADDAFLLNYHLDNMSASRRGYDIIHQDPFFLMHNPKFEVFAKVDPRNYYITEKRTVPVGFILVKEDGQGTVYRKSLMTSERDIQETNAHAFGARLQGSGAPLGVPVSATAGFETAKSTMSSMANSSSVAEAVGYSRTKKYALVVDHPYITLSDNFIDAVEDARRDLKYQALINKFGTHYPYAVTYGAAAKMTQSFSEESYSKRVREERNFKAEAGASVFGVGGSAHFSNMQGRETGESGSMGSEGATFVSVGGNGSWDQNGYTAGETPAPILLDLRPIYELLNPMNFPGEPEVYQTVRRNLKRAVETYIQRNTGPLSSAAHLPEVIPVKKEIEEWHVYVRHAQCNGSGVWRVKDFTGMISVKGYRGGPNSGLVTTKDKEMTVSCKKNAKAATYSYKISTPGLVVIRGTREQIAAYQFDFTLNYRYRPSLNQNKFYTAKKSFSAVPALVNGLRDETSKTMKWKIDGGANPDIYLDVRFKRKQ